MQKRSRKSAACWAVWVAIEIFRVAIELLVLCRNMVLYVATWFSGCRWLLGRDKGPHSVATGVPTVSQQFCDKGSLVTIETVTIRGQGCDRA